MKRLLLKAAANADEGDAPYDFAEFQRRAAARRSTAAPLAVTRSWQLLRIAAVVAPLGLVLLIAAVLRVPAPSEGDAFTVAFAEPALVEAGELASVTDLQDHIAWIDTMLSGAAAGADLRALQESRRALSDSLQQVRFARTEDRP